MDSGPDFFLEVLCLYIYANDTDAELIVRNVLLAYHDEVKSGSAIDAETSQFYIKILEELLDNDIDLDNKAEIHTLLLKFENLTTAKDNPKALEHLEEIINSRGSISGSRVRKLKSKAKKWVIWVNGNRNLKRLFRNSQKVINTSNPMIQDALMGELLHDAKRLTETYEDNTSLEDSTIDFIDMSCAISLKKGLSSYTKKRIIAGFKTGLQGLNRMFGKSNGPAPGEFIGFAALSHHFKSGILMALARWLAIYNNPRNENGKQAAIIFISLENEIYENMMMWFRDAYHNYYGKQPLDLSENEIIEKTSELYAARGFKLLVYRKEGDLFGYEEWRALHEELSAKYEITATILDYISLMDLGEIKDNPAKLRQELMCKMKNYCNRHAMLCATGLQLDTGAAQIAASGIINTVKKFGSAHLADCKGAIREFDFLAFMHIQKNHLNDEYLTVAWAKHKYCVTKDIDKFFAYKFHEGIGIKDDINGSDMSVIDIYNVEESNTNTEGGLF